MSAAFAVADLGQLTEIGEGGQAKVYSASNAPGQLFKRYFQPEHVNLRPLQRLIALGGHLPAEDYAFVCQRAALPQAEVHEAGRLVGFLMPSAPSHFSEQFRSGPKLLEVSYLLREVKPMWQHLPMPDDAQRVQLVRDFFLLVSVLHRNQIILGDISMKNLLWSLTGDPSVFLLDCDGWRFAGDLPAATTLQTMDWDDKSLPHDDEATLDSDRYKMCLLALRIAYRQIGIRPGTRSAAPAGFPDAFMQLLHSVSNDVGGSRPDMDELLRSLEGRSLITLGKVTKKTRSSNVQQPENRVSIPVRKVAI